jgi:hypothetical protein
MQVGITKEDLGTPKVIMELKYITTHLLIQIGSFMHLKNRRLSQKCPLSGIKEEDMN